MKKTYRRRRCGSKKFYRKSKRNSKKNFSRRCKRGGRGDPDPMRLNAYPQYAQSTAQSNEEKWKKQYPGAENSKYDKQSNETPTPMTKIYASDPMVNASTRNTNNESKWKSSYPNAQNSKYD